MDREEIRAVGMVFRPFLNFELNLKYVKRENYLNYSQVLMGSFYNSRDDLNLQSHLIAKTKSERSGLGLNDLEYLLQAKHSSRPSEYRVKIRPLIPAL